MPCNESTVTVASRILPDTFVPSQVVLILSILLLSPLGGRFILLLPAFAPLELAVLEAMVSLADEVGVAGVAVEDRGCVLLEQSVS